MKSIRVTEEHYSFLASLQDKTNRNTEENMIRFLSLSDYEMLKDIIISIDFGDNSGTYYDYLDDDQVNKLVDEINDSSDMGLGEEDIAHLMRDLND